MFVQMINLLNLPLSFLKLKVLKLFFLDLPAYDLLCQMIHSKAQQGNSL